jgi:hypothetical protein
LRNLTDAPLGHTNILRKTILRVLQ